jgi:hypothetical protein
MDGNGFGRWQQRGGGGSQRWQLALGGGVGQQLKMQSWHLAVPAASKRTYDDGISVSVIEA